VVTAVFVALVWYEVRTSTLQAKLFGLLMRNNGYSVQPGPSPTVHFPQHGPYDMRLGYSRIPEFTENLRKISYEVSAQARPSKLVTRVLGIQVFPAYREKAQAGLTISDERNNTVFAATYPRRVYATFESIPPVVVHSLLFVENRELLDNQHPSRNPAIEWDRFANALIGYGLKKVHLGYERSGGSTLATQLEKLRHSPRGITGSPAEKLRQMLSASLRSYQDGEQTIDARKRIVLDYINSLPLASQAGYGEVIGLGDGLELWFGADFDEVNRMLHTPEDQVPAAQYSRWVSAYRQALSLILAVRKPTGYLQGDRAALNARVDSFLPLLSSAGIITERLRDRSAKTYLAYHDRVIRAEPLEAAEKKTVDSLRVDLLKALRLPSLYELDRLDLSVKTAVDGAAAEAAARKLAGLSDPNQAIRAGLTGEKMLKADGSDAVIYSFTLYERGKDVNLLRVQTDNYEGALNINEGTKLELGSTAKLRTLVTYLEIVAELHRRYAKYSPEEVKGMAASPDDHMSQWALEFLQSTNDRSLEAMIDAALDRKYSGNPWEGFYTGGGLHYFSNFNPDDNGKMIRVRDAFHRSTNLVFVRMMRDIVNYYLYERVGVDPALFEDPENPARKEYVTRFADLEGQQYLRRFYSRHSGRSSGEMLNSLLSRTRKRRVPLAALYRSVRPGDSIDRFQQFIQDACPDCDLADVEALYDKYRKDAFDLNDRGYLAGVHPLELWLVSYLQENPKATLSDVMQATENERQDIYKWLFQSRKKRAQDIRIRTLLEKEAFDHLYRAWKKLGFPFTTLVASYATAIGSSGDTPAALAELAGIIVNEGVRQPTVRFRKLQFAEGTPFETVFEPRRVAPERVLPIEIARAVKKEMLGVVQFGTAGRAYQSVKLSDNRILPVGGKTGTGDNRFEIHTAQGWLKFSRVINRTATFVFLIDDRFFGTVVAYVPGSNAASYNFTSALPVQVFRNLVPTFRSTLDQAYKSEKIEVAGGARPKTSAP
jgi:membrane peptidoglycan carboxypeptidase